MFMHSVAYWLLTVALTIAVSLGTGCTGVSDSAVNVNGNSSAGNGNPSANDNAQGGGAPETCEPPCDMGQVCNMGVCAPADPPQAEFGFTNEQTDVCTALTDGGRLPYFTLGQGGSHTFFTIRVAGISTSADERLDVSYRMIRRTDGFVLIDFQQRTSFVPLDDGTLEAERRLVFILEFPDLLDGVMVDGTFVVTSPIEPTQTVTIEQSLVLGFEP
ncbi:MAG: hypothetical protein AABZ47_14030 [Planctomycetota bacterium]